MRMMNQIRKAFVLPASKRSNTATKSRRKRSGSAGRPTAEELTRRKSLVMEVATALFIEHGYAATSLVEIAALSGVATRTLYQHFGDKEAIFREVIYARNLSEAIERPSVRPGDTLFSTLRRVADYTYAVTLDEKSMGLMRLMIAESNRFPEFMASIATTILAHFHRNIQTVFEELETAGLVPAGNHTRSAELFSDISLGNHPIMIYTKWNAAPPSSADLDERVDLFIQGRYGLLVTKTAKTKKAPSIKA